MANPTRKRFFPKRLLRDLLDLPADASDAAVVEHLMELKRKAADPLGLEEDSAAIKLLNQALARERLISAVLEELRDIYRKENQVLREARMREQDRAFLDSICREVEDEAG